AIAGILPGLWPAISAARVDVLRVLGSQGAGSAVGVRPSRMRRWLVGAQIAGSTMFLAIAGLFLQTYLVLSTFDLGFDRDHLVIADFVPAANGLDANRGAQFAINLRDRIRNLPGIVDVAMIDRAPFFVGYDMTTKVWLPGTSCDGDTCRSYPAYRA